MRVDGQEQHLWPVPGEEPLVATKGVNSRWCASVCWHSGIHRTVVLLHLLLFAPWSVSHSVVPTLCDPKTVACQAPQSLGIPQVRLLEWVAVPSSSRSSRPRDWTQVSCITGRFFTTWGTREALLSLIPDRINLMNTINLSVFSWV